MVYSSEEEIQRLFACYVIRSRGTDMYNIADIITTSRMFNNIHTIVEINGLSDKESCLDEESLIKILLTDVSSINRGLYAPKKL